MAKPVLNKYDEFCSFPNLYRSLMELISPEGLLSSAAVQAKDTIFARDAIIAALDLVEWMPQLASQVIISLARHQATTDNPLTEAQPGKIPHEYRAQFMGGKEIGPRQRHILEELAEKWGGTPAKLTYYGASDVTPQFVRLVGQYCRQYGDHYLSQRFQHVDGTVKTIADATLEATNWIVAQIQTSKLGLVEFCRQNPQSHPYQTMRNNPTALLHEDGTPADPNQPIAALEVQAYAYDALVIAVELFPEHPQAEVWQTMAVELRKAIFQHFWLSDRNYFAMALDRDERGEFRPVKTTSNAMSELLDTHLFDDAPDTLRQTCLSSIITLMFSDEFMTAAGPRMRGRQYYELLPYWDYQGSRSTWAAVTNLFARGLARQGFNELTEELESRLLNSLNRTRAFVELWYIDAEDQIGYEPFMPTTTEGHIISAPMVPKASQIWTISAALRIKLGRLSAGTNPPATEWQQRTTSSVLNKLQKNQTIHIDKTRGQQLEADFLKRHQ